jgi:hypothetical protein
LRTAFTPAAARDFALVHRRESASRAGGFRLLVLPGRTRRRDPGPV